MVEECGFFLFFRGILCLERNIVNIRDVVNLFMEDWEFFEKYYDECYVRFVIKGKLFGKFGGFEVVCGVLLSMRVFIEKSC